MSYLCYSLDEAAQQLGMSETVLFRLSQFLKMPASAYEDLGYISFKGDLTFSDGDIGFFRQVKDRLLAGETLDEVKQRIRSDSDAIPTHSTPKPPTFVTSSVTPTPLAGRSGRMFSPEAATAASSLDMSPAYAHAESSEFAGPYSTPPAIPLAGPQRLDVVTAEFLPDVAPDVTFEEPVVTAPVRAVRNPVPASYAPPLAPDQAPGSARYVTAPEVTSDFPTPRPIGLSSLGEAFGLRRSQASVHAFAHGFETPEAPRTTKATGPMLQGNVYSLAEPAPLRASGGKAGGLNTYHSQEPLKKAADKSFQRYKGLRRPNLNRVFQNLAKDLHQPSDSTGAAPTSELRAAVGPASGMEEAPVRPDIQFDEKPAGGLSAPQDQPLMPVPTPWQSMIDAALRDPHPLSARTQAAAQALRYQALSQPQRK